MLKNQKVLIGVIVVLVLLIIGGGAWFIMSRNNASALQAQQATDDSQEQVVGTLQPSDIGLKLILTPDDKKISFSADKLQDVRALEWNFTYDADIPASDQTPDNAGQKVTQEFGSDQPIVLNGKTSYTSTPRELGTCSSGHCRFDTGIQSVKIELKVTKTDGNVYQVTDSINL